MLRMTDLQNGSIAHQAIRADRSSSPRPSKRIMRSASAAHVSRQFLRRLMVGWFVVTVRDNCSARRTACSGSAPAGLRFLGGVAGAEKASEVTFASDAPEP